MAKPCTPHPIAQRVQLFKPSADNGGVKGQGPLPQSTSHLCEKEEPSLERDSSFLFYSLRKRSAMTAAASAVDSAPVSR